MKRQARIFEKIIALYLDTYNQEAVNAIMALSREEQSAFVLHLWHNEAEHEDSTCLWGIKVALNELEQAPVSDEPKKEWKVRLLEGHDARPEQAVNGYLGNVFGSGKIELYSRGQAIKKARMFKGKIEKHDPSNPLEASTH